MGTTGRPRWVRAEGGNCPEKVKRASQIVSEREKERVRGGRGEGKERGKDRCNSNGFKRVVFKARRPRESVGVEKGGTETKNRETEEKGKEKGTRVQRKEKRSEVGEVGASERERQLVAKG